MSYVQLTGAQISQLVQQGCSAQDWQKVSIASACDLSRIRNVNFYGTIQIGVNTESISSEGANLPCGLYNATIIDCIVGNHVRISNIGSSIKRYVIDEDVLIENVDALIAEEKATFGNGTELDVLNEGGGRGTKIINDLTSQVAYLQAALRHNAGFTKKLSDLIDARIDSTKQTTGHICAHARIVHCGVIRNIIVGPHARLSGAQLLENGTINSCAEHPTEIGSGVIAKSFIVSEGARIESGAILDKVFVGQAVKMGKQYSSENSLFFANCEAFHGEAVSLFAGPYTVTHHKSTLLIAGLFSFYNAGSGSNQSNHMYKLGPVHQGIFERGSKTGSFSYVLLESHIGAFSVVIGKHFANMSLTNLPFSYIHEEEGASKVVPGMNLFSVGTVRDGEKWPKRDNRKTPNKRDLITFDVFSPYTVEKMRHGRTDLLALSESTPKEKTSVIYGGAQISRLMLRKSAKYYNQAVTRYLNDKVLARLQQYLIKGSTLKDAVKSLEPKYQLAHPEQWTDLSGLLTPRERLTALEQDVTSGSISTYDQLLSRLQQMHDSYSEDEWSYIYYAFLLEYSAKLNELTQEQVLGAVEEWYKSATALHGMILDDSKKEFGAFARIGYGLDQSEDDAKKDFEAVRGSSETNSVVQKLVIESNSMLNRYTQLKELLSLH